MADQRKGEFFVFVHLVVLLSLLQEREQEQETAESLKSPANASATDNATSCELSFHFVSLNSIQFNLSPQQPQHEHQDNTTKQFCRFISFSLWLWLGHIDSRRPWREERKTLALS